MNKPLALVIDDEPDIRELLSLTLGRMDIETAVAEDVKSAKAQLSGKRFDICLTDMRLPDGDGLELVEWMQKHSSGVPVAVITAHGNVETAVQALKLGAFDFISKPLDLKNLRNIVRNALKLDRQKPGETTQLLGDSQAMQELRDLVERVARSQAPVHISGESGTGKELVARLIHDSGPRSDGPFVPVNCGAIPAELMESEFFGHTKGSFTGAVRDKIGLVQSADSGTLFLDEIADLPLSMQVKLLRVIQEQTIRPVGSSQEQSVDVRILSATHRILSEMVAGGEFREDLAWVRPATRWTPAPGLHSGRIIFPATSGNSRTCWNGRSLCAPRARSRNPTLPCRPPAPAKPGVPQRRRAISVIRSKTCSGRRSSMHSKKRVTTRLPQRDCSA
jgi:two-component system response regulator PilR (NtrC family)